MGRQNVRRQNRERSKNKSHTFLVAGRPPLIRRQTVVASWSVTRTYAAWEVDRDGRKGPSKSKERHKGDKQQMA
jgi:hypothetical protein